MPNQRAPEKRMLGAWIPYDELETFKLAARAAGMTLTDWILHALENEIQRGAAVPAHTRKARRKG